VPSCFTSMSVVQSCMRGRFHRNCGVVPTTGHTIGPLILLYLSTCQTRKPAMHVNRICVDMDKSIPRAAAAAAPTSPSVCPWNVKFSTAMVAICSLQRASPNAGWDTRSSRRCQPHPRKHILIENSPPLRKSHVTCVPTLPIRHRALEEG
jgi:hypothetical protein